MENIPKMTRQTGQIQTSVLVSQEFYRLCKEYRIKFSEAMRVGIALMLAEKGVKAYDNKLNIFRRMKAYQALAEEASQKVEQLKNGN